VTLKRQSGEMYLVNGRIVTPSMEMAFTDKVFSDPWTAAIWLMNDDDGRLFGAWVSFDWEAENQEGYDATRTVR